MSNDYEEIEVSPPAQPGSGATIILFDTTTMFGGEPSNVIAGRRMSRLSVTFSRISADSGALGLIPYSSTDKGVNWDQAEAGVTVTSASTTGTVNTHDYALDRYKDFKLEYTNSAAVLTAWRVAIKVICGDRASVT